MTVIDAIATALQQDAAAARNFVARLAEQGFMVCKRDDPSAPRDALSVMPPPTPNISELNDDVAQGPTH